MLKYLPLLFLALGANCWTLIILAWTKEIPSEDIPFWDTVISVIWVIAMVGSIVYTIIKRKQLFQRWAALLTIIILFFCTPAALFAMYRLNHSGSETDMKSADIDYSSGKACKIEHWEYFLSSHPYVNKRFVSPKTAILDMDDPSFKKDGTWKYLSDDGEVIKTEIYSAGKLIAVKGAK